MSELNNSENKSPGCWILIIGFIMAILIGIGVIWGLIGYAILLIVIAVVSLSVATGKAGYVGSKATVIAIFTCLISGFLGVILFDYAGDLDRNTNAEKAFQRLSLNPSVNGCASFVRSYDKTPHYNEVMEMYLRESEKEGLSSLNKLAEELGANDNWGRKASIRVKQICDSFYNYADSLGTIEGWEYYMNNVPTKYFKDSEKKIETIELKEWNTDEKAWEKAKDLNTIPYYSRYVKLYPKGKHRSEAEKLIIDLEVDEIFAGSYGSLPSLNKEFSFGNKYKTNISITNKTNSYLQILYSGPDSKRCDLAPGCQSTITLKNGKYRVAASVTSSSVRSFAGTESLDGGDYRVEYYISSSKY